MCTINLFAFSKLVPRVSWLSNRKEVAFSSYQKPIIPWERGCVFSYSVKIELRSLTQVSHVTKMKKKKAKKKLKKLKKLKKVKASLKLSSIYTSSEWLYHHPIHRDGRRRESHGNRVPWSCYPANCGLCELK